MKSFSNLNLIILLWNANGLTTRKYELEIFLHAKEIDLVLNTETHIKSTKFFKQDYITHRSDHPDSTAHET